MSSTISRQSRKMRHSNVRLDFFSIKLFHSHGEDDDVWSSSFGLLELKSSKLKLELRASKST
jgi:hypothetical protein